MTVRLSSFVVIISFFFILSYMQLFSPLYLLAPFLMLQLFCYWFLLVYFHFIYCIVQFCLFFTSSRSLLNIISCIFFICSSLFFLRSLAHLCFHYSEYFSMYIVNIHFLFVLLDMFLVPSCKIFFWTSFCLTFCGG